MAGGFVGNGLDRSGPCGGSRSIPRRGQYPSLQSKRQSCNIGKAPGRDESRPYVPLKRRVLCRGNFHLGGAAGQLIQRGAERAFLPRGHTPAERHGVVKNRFV